MHRHFNHNDLFHVIQMLGLYLFFEAGRCLSTAERYPVVIVGGGPAGLATSAELRRRRVEHVVLERGEAAVTPG